MNGLIIIVSSPGTFTTTPYVWTPRAADEGCGIVWAFISPLTASAWRSEADVLCVCIGVVGCKRKIMFANCSLSTGAFTGRSAFRGMFLCAIKRKLRKRFSVGICSYIVRKFNMMAVGCGGLLKGLWFAIIVLMCFQNWIVLVSSLFWWCFWFSVLSQARWWTEGRVLELYSPAVLGIESSLTSILRHTKWLSSCICTKDNLNNVTTKLLLQDFPVLVPCPRHSTRKLLPFIKLFPHPLHVVFIQRTISIAIQIETVFPIKSFPIHGIYAESGERMTSTNKMAFNIIQPVLTEWEPFLTSFS